MPKTTYDESVVYCGIEDVERWFRKPDGFDGTTNPTDEEVLDFIYEASEVIDDHTRNSWRANTYENSYKQYQTRYRWDAGRPLNLHKMYIRSLDKLEIWDGSKWDDWIADSARTEGRENDYWLDNEMGQLWIYDRFVWRARPQLRVTYTYGKDVTTSQIELSSGTTVDRIDQPRVIRRAAGKLVAADLLGSDQYSQLTPGTGEGMSPQAAAEKWRDDVFGRGDKSGLLDRHVISPTDVSPY